VLVVLGGAAIGYAVWRSRQAADDMGYPGAQGTAPDAFGAAVEDVDNGQRAPART
jgi:hypothetical protein